MKKITTILFMVLFAFGLLTGCGKKSDDASAPIVIYDGDYSEMQIVHQMVKMLVENQTSVKVEIRDQMSAVNNFKNMSTGGDSDLVNSYDGSVLTTYLKKNVSDVPEGKTIYDYANELASEQYHIHLLDKLGSENTYAIGVTQALAEKYNLETISDLTDVASELVFGAEHEFFSEEGDMKFGPFSNFYGLNFKDAKAIDLALKYSAIESGNIDVVEVYSTDGMNKKVGLKILKDDRNYFPEYNDALLVKDDLFERYADVAPNLEDVLNMLGGKFTDESMTNLTYEVDVEGKTPEEVAKTFLEENNMLDE